MSETPAADSLPTASPKWKEGDFTLLSSDNVSFKVSSRALFSVR